MSLFWRTLLGTLHHDGWQIAPPGFACRKPEKQRQKAKVKTPKARVEVSPKLTV
jgi:hypothetical protein